VVVEYGSPLRFEPDEDPARELQQQAADLILGRIKALHAELSARGGSPRSTAR
jgi:hypothetical protein